MDMEARRQVHTRKRRSRYSEDVQLSTVEPCRFFLLAMQHEGQEYEGILFFEEALICRQVYAVLVQQLGEPIRQIGDIDLNDTV